MATLIEESPGYADELAAHLAKTGRRRAPWGTVLAHGQFTMTRSTREMHARHELGEVAIALLAALGVSEETLDKLAELPLTVSGAELVAKFQELQAEGPSNG